MVAPQPQQIEASEGNILDLRLLIHSPGLLSKKGFVLDQLSKAELDRKRRCRHCSRALSTKELKAARGQEELPYQDPAEGELSAETAVPPPPADALRPTVDEQLSAILKENGPAAANPGPDGAKKTKKGKTIPPQCHYHPGEIRAGRWSCCQGPIISKPCANQDVHTVRSYATRELEDQWRFFHTPYHRDDNHPKFARAIAIDCEMGTNEYGESELIRVSVVDYFTGAVLLDKLVWPDVKMKHYNTKYSGVTAKAMHDARRSRTCLFGRGAARKAIWKFVSPETVVIGHAVHGDLTSLRWIHHRIVDTLLLEEAYAKKVRQKLEREWEEEQERKRQEAGEEGAVEEEPQGGEDKTRTEKKEEGPKIPQMPMGLKALAKERLDRMIQVGGRGHDSVEDALATRDLLHWHMVHRAAKIQ